MTPGIKYRSDKVDVETDQVLFGVEESDAASLNVAVADSTYTYSPAETARILYATLGGYFYPTASLKVKSYVTYYRSKNLNADIFSFDNWTDLEYTQINTLYPDGGYRSIDGDTRINARLSLQYRINKHHSIAINGKVSHLKSDSPDVKLFLKYLQYESDVYYYSTAVEYTRSF